MRREHARIAKADREAEHGEAIQGKSGFEGHVTPRTLQLYTTAPSILIWYMPVHAPACAMSQSKPVSPYAGMPPMGQRLEAAVLHVLLDFHRRCYLRRPILVESWLVWWILHLQQVDNRLVHVRDSVCIRVHRAAVFARLDRTLQALPMLAPTYRRYSLQCDHARNRRPWNANPPEAMKRQLPRRDIRGEIRRAPHNAQAGCEHNDCDAARAERATPAGRSF